MWECCMMCVEWGSAWEGIYPQKTVLLSDFPTAGKSYLCALGSLGNKPSEDGLPCGTVLLEALLGMGAVQLERAWSSNVHLCHEETETWTKLLNPAPYTSAGLTWFSKLKCQCCGCSTAVSFPCLLDNDDAPRFLKTSPKSGEISRKTCS